MEDFFIHKVIKEEKLFTYLKDVIALSMRQTNEFMKQKTLLLNGEPLTKNGLLHVGDELKLIFLEESNDYEQEAIPLTILYESIDLLIVDKPPMMLVHPTANHLNHTLANAVAAYFHQIGLKRKIRFVNRIDRDTSGIVIIAKNAYSHQFLAKQFESTDFLKQYLALVDGHLTEKTGTKVSHLEKHEEKMVEGDEGKRSETHYQVLKECEGVSLVACQLVTGRTHQIRVHLASLGHPILGDELYGTKSPFIARLALHSHQITFVEPRTFETKTIICDCPTDMNRVLNV